jgi:uncharacterized membrane protein
MAQVHNPRQAPPDAAEEDWADDDGSEEFDYAPVVPAWRPIAALVLSIAGFGDSLYLTIEHYTGNSALVCSANSVVDCLKVTTSSQSMVFGVFPVALLGLIFFTAMLVINLPILWRSPIRWIAWLRLGTVVGGMGFVIYLLYSELFSIKAICLWCTGVHVVTFLLFILVVSSAQAMLGNPWERDVA